VASNLELKTRLQDLQTALDRGLSQGATDEGILVQEDTYFRCSQGRLKLRCFGDGTSELIAYQRPNRGSARYSEYIKVPVGDRDAVKHALELVLGVRVVVRKKRHLLLYRGCRIHLDDVDQLGTFLEFEVPAGAGAHALMKELCGIFQVRAHETIAGSYADLLGEPPGIPDRP